VKLKKVHKMGDVQHTILTHFEKEIFDKRSKKILIFKISNF